MNASYEVGDGYLYATLSGEFTPFEARRFSSECVNATRSHGLKRMLCDITLVTGYEADQVSVMTRFETSKFVAGILPEGFKLAVLETLQQCKGSRFDEDVMVNRGAMVKIVSSLNEALEWLGVDCPGQE